MTEAISYDLQRQLALLQRPSYRDSLSDIGYKNGLTLDRAKDLIQENLILIRDQGTNLWYYGADKKLDHNWRYGLTRGHFEVFWPSGRVLADKVSETAFAPLITDKFVLSVGAGSGLAEIYLVKKCRPHLMACLDSNVFARAAIELNAVANDVSVGDVLITISNPGLLGSVLEDDAEYRLFDTVLAADCLHGKEGVRRQEVVALVNILKGLNHSGIDVIIADRNTAEGERRSGNLIRASLYEAAQVTCGLTPETLVTQEDILIPRAELKRIGVSFGDCAMESVGLYHWPAQRAEHPLSRLNYDWWRVGLD